MHACTYVCTMHILYTHTTVHYPLNTPTPYATQIVCTCLHAGNTQQNIILLYAGITLLVSILQPTTSWSSLSLFQQQEQYYMSGNFVHILLLQYIVWNCFSFTDWKLKCTWCFCTWYMNRSQVEKEPCSHHYGGHVANCTFSIPDIFVLYF